MPNTTTSRIPRVFLDSSVIIAGIFRDEGGAGAVLYAIELGLLEGVANHQVIEEVTRNLRNKGATQTLARFQQFAAQIGVYNGLPSKEQVKHALEYVPPKDAPILAACLSSPVDYLVTLDLQHYGKLIKASPFHFKVATPAQLIKMI